MFQNSSNCSKVSDAHAPAGEPGADLRTMMREFAARLLAEFALEIERDPRGFKERALRLLRQNLPPRPGRPCDGQITRAAMMRAQGKDWREIYAACLPNTLLPESRQVAQSRLRSAVRSRGNARKRRKHGLISSEKKT
jgi:hypothetical protein